MSRHRDSSQKRVSVFWKGGVSVRANRWYWALFAFTSMVAVLGFWLGESGVLGPF